MTRTEIKAFLLKSKFSLNMKCVISVPLDEFAIGGVYIQNLYQHHYSPPPLITHFIYNLI